MLKTLMPRPKTKIADIPSASTQMSDYKTKPIVIDSADEWDFPLFEGILRNPIASQAEELIREIETIVSSMDIKMPEKTASRLADYMAERHYLAIPDIIGSWDFDQASYGGCRSRNITFKSSIRHNNKGDSDLLKGLVKEKRNRDCSKSFKVEVSNEEVLFTQEYPNYNNFHDREEAAAELSENTKFFLDAHTKAKKEINRFNNSVRHTCRVVFGLEEKQ